VKPISGELTIDSEHSKSLDGESMLRFNFAMGLLHGIFFQTGMTFSAPSSVLPLFLQYFTGSQAMIGLLSGLMNAGGVLPQLFAAHKLERMQRKKPVLLVSIWLRAAFWLGLAVLVYFCPSDKPLIALVGLVVLLFGFSFAGGVATIPFSEIWAKTLPLTVRGRFFGHRQLWGGVMAVAAAYLVRRILANTDIKFPQNYALLFFLSFLFISISYVALSCVREPPGTVSAHKPPFGTFIRRSFALLYNDRNLGLLIATQLGVGFTAFALPFYVLYGTNKLSMPAEQVGLLIASQTAGGIVSNLLWARLSDRIGNRIVIILTAAIAAVIPIIALICTYTGWTLLVVVFFLIGCAISGGGIGFVNYLLEIAPEEVRPTYIALQGTIMGATMVFPIFGGLVIDAWSYPAAFWITAVVSLGGLFLATRLKRARNVENSARVEL